MIATRVVCATALSCLGWVLARPAAAQPPSASPRACPVPIGLARSASAGEVRVGPTDGNGNGASAQPTGRTVFYAPVAAQRTDSGAATKPMGVHASLSGDLTAAAPTSAAARIPVRRARSWTVQVASFETLDAAQGMEQALCTRGYEARIIGTNRPYEVRVGRFPSSDSALTVARRLTSRHLTVFVTAAE